MPHRTPLSLPIASLGCEGEGRVPGLGFQPGGLGFWADVCVWGDRWPPGVGHQSESWGKNAGRPPQPGEPSGRPGT